MPKTAVLIQSKYRGGLFYNSEHPSPSSFSVAIVDQILGMRLRDTVTR